MASCSSSSLPSGASVVILADYNFSDPKPHSIWELLKFKKEEVFIQRINTFSSMKGFVELHPGLPNIRFVIVACLGPIIADSASGDDRKESVARAIVETLGLVKDLLVSNRKLRVFIVPPLYRLQPSGFKDDIANCLTYLIPFCDGFRRAQLIKSVTVTKSMLQKDGVTLVPSGVVRYIESVVPHIRLAIDHLIGRTSTDSDLSLDDIVSDVESVHDTSSVIMPNVTTGTVTEDPLSEDEESEIKKVSGASSEPGPSGGFQSNMSEVITESAPVQPSFSLDAVDPDLPQLEDDSTCRDIVKVVNSLTTKFVDKCLQDHLDTALSLETDDWTANCFMQRKVVINGYQGTSYPSAAADRNALFKPLVAATIQQVLGRSVIYSVVGRGGELRGKSLPPVEVVFAEVEIAEEFRREGSSQSKAKREGVSHLYFNSCLTLSTRVRIEILRAIASHITSPERTAFCVANNSRPYLSLGPPGKGLRESLRFTEAIEAFGDLIDKKSPLWNKSYERAGLKFIGKMSKYFLVLNDKRALELNAERKGPEANNNQVAANVQGRAIVRQFRVGKRAGVPDQSGPSPKK